jgi:GH25 family lysozyme M1 (1,4-beta-N-acetylmuramidase)
MANYPDHSKIVVWPDVSNYQPFVSGALLKAQGYGALSFKISEGLYYIDQTAKAHRDEAVANGLIPMAYHFISDEDGRAQADRAATLIHGLHGSYENIAFMLDVERCTHTPIYQNVVDFAARWHELNTGIPLGLYSGAWFWTDAWGNPHSPADWDIASDYNYGGPGARPVDPWWILEVPLGGVTPGYVGRDWGGIPFHARQFTDAGNAGGAAPVDMNVFWGDLNAFKDQVLAKTPGPKPQPNCPPQKPNRFAHEPVIKQGADDRVLPVGVHPVKDLQNAINVLSGRGLAVDGVFGSGTDKAVRDYQTMCMDGVHHHERVDGIVGPSTWGSLDANLQLRGK